MDGNIVVSSVPGVGATFSFYVLVHRRDFPTFHNNGLLTSKESTYSSTSIITNPQKQGSTQWEGPTRSNLQKYNNAFPYSTGSISTESEEEFADEWGNLAVLLVEDNHVNQQLASRMLKKLGVVLDVASDGFEGVARVSEKTYDLILMDISMPGMSGYEATECIRRNLPAPYVRQPYIVAMTANALQSDRDKCSEATMNDFIAKPFDLSDVRRALNGTVLYRRTADPCR